MGSFGDLKEEVKRKERKSFSEPTHLWSSPDAYNLKKRGFSMMKELMGGSNSKAGVTKRFL